MIEVVFHRLIHLSEQDDFVSSKAQAQSEKNPHGSSESPRDAKKEKAKMTWPQLTQKVNATSTNNNDNKTRLLLVEQPVIHMLNEVVRPQDLAALQDEEERGGPAGGPSGEQGAAKGSVNDVL